MKEPGETRKPAGSALSNPAKESMVLSALYIAQEQHGKLTPEIVERVALRMGMQPGEVFSIASFYTLFRTRPTGRFVIQVCDGLSCYLCDGADRIAEYVGAKLNLKPGESSADGRFSLEMVQCLASCGTAPAMRVNDQLYENLTPAGIDAILERLLGEV